MKISDDQDFGNRSSDWHWDVGGSGGRARDLIAW
jgi:hypothetical protein